MKPIYLESDEEITSVIDKISQLSDRHIALVAPKNSGLFQSLINLKLLAKEAKKQDKELSIIAPGKTGMRLAEQVGLRSYASLGALGAGPKNPPKPAPDQSVPTEVVDGVKVNRYQPPVVGETAAPELAEEPVKPIAEPLATETIADEPVKTTETEPVAVSREEVPSELLPHPPKTPPSESATKDDKDDSPEMPAIVSRGYSTRTEFNVPWRSVAIAGALLVVIFLVLMVFLPRATVTVNFPATAVKKTVTITAATSATEGELSLPASLLVSEQALTKTVTATGKKDIGAKATGTVSVKNCEDTSTHSLAAGSKLTSSSKTFLSNSAVTVPAGKFSNGGQTCNSDPVSVAVTAEAAGESYNLSNATFAIANLSGRFTATGTTSGGSTKQVTVLTQEDIDKSLNELKTEAAEKGAADIRAKATTQTLLDGASWTTVKNQSVDKKVGEQVESATASYSAEIAALVFDANSAQEKVKTAAGTDLSANQELVIPEEKQPTLVAKAVSEDRATLTVEAVVEGFAVEKVDKSAIARAVARKSISGAQSILASQFNAASSEITVSPSWWFGRLPLLASEITIEHGFSEAVPE